MVSFSIKSENNTDKDTSIKSNKCSYNNFSVNETESKFSQSILKQNFNKPILKPNRNLYKEYLREEIQNWLNNIPTYNSIPSMKINKEKVINDLVNAVHDLSMEIDSDDYDLKLKSQIENCLNSLYMCYTTDKLKKYGIHDFLVKRIKYLNDKWLINDIDCEGHTFVRQERKYYSSNNNEVINLEFRNLIEKEILDWIAKKKLKFYNRMGKLMKLDDVKELLFNAITTFKGNDSKNLKLALKKKLLDIMNSMRIDSYSRNKIIRTTELASELASITLKYQLNNKSRKSSATQVRSAFLNEIIGPDAITEREFKCMLMTEIDTCLENVNLAPQVDIVNEIAAILINNVESIISQKDKATKYEISNILSSIGVPELSISDIVDSMVESVRKTLSENVSNVIVSDTTKNPVNSNLSGTLLVFTSSQELPKFSCLRNDILLWLKEQPQNIFLSNDKSYQNKKAQELSDDIKKNKGVISDIILSNWLSQIMKTEEKLHLNDVKKNLENRLKRALDNYTECNDETRQHVKCVSPCCVFDESSNDSFQDMTHYRSGLKMSQLDINKLQSTPKKEPVKLNPEEISYIDSLVPVVREWIETLPRKFDDKNYKETAINDLAGHLMDEAKTFQIDPEQREENTGQIISLDLVWKNVIYRWMCKFNVEDIRKIETQGLKNPYLARLFNTVKSIPTPDLTRPQYGTRTAIRGAAFGPRWTYRRKHLNEKDQSCFYAQERDILEDQISVWMHEQPSEIYINKDRNFQTKKVAELADAVENDLDNEDQKLVEISFKIAEWLKKIVKPGKKAIIDKMTADLKERLVNLPRDETIRQNVEQNRLEAKRRHAAHAEQKELQGECCKQEFNETDVPDSDKTFMEFIKKFVDYNYNVEDSLTRRALCKLLVTELRKLNPPTRKEVYDNFAKAATHEQFDPEKLGKELKYMNMISDWMKTIPFHRHFNSPGNPERIEIVIALAKDIADVEAERIRLPGEMNYANLLQDVIYEFTMHMLRPHLEETFTGDQLRNAILQLVNTIRNSRDDENILAQQPKVKKVNEEEVGKLVLDFIQYSDQYVDDEFKLRAWNHKLVKELKKMILEASNPSALTTKQVYRYLANLSLPSEEQVRLFEIKLGYDKEIAEWLKMIPLQPMKTRQDQEERAQKIVELGEKMVEREIKHEANPNDTHCDTELRAYINKWVLEMPLDPLAVVSMPAVTKQLLSRMENVNRQVEERRRIPDQSDFSHPDISAIDSFQNMTHYRSGITMSQLDANRLQSTPKKQPVKLNPEETAYLNAITSVVRQWVETLPKKFDDFNYKETAISDLAGHIMDEVKPFQIDPVQIDQYTGQRKDLETVWKNVIHNWMSKFNAEDIRILELQGVNNPSIVRLMDILVTIPIPDLTRPQYGNRTAMRGIAFESQWASKRRIPNEPNKSFFYAHERDVLEDQISVWMHEQPSEVYINKDRNFQTEKVAELADVVEEDLNNKDQGPNEISLKVAEWLNKIIKPGKQTIIDKMTADLKERLMNLPRDKTIKQNVDVGRSEADRRHAAHTEIKATRGECCKQEFDETVVSDTDKTLMEFVKKFVEHNYDAENPLARRAFSKVLVTEFRKLSPPTRKEVYEKYAKSETHEQFDPEKLGKELKYINIISDWLKNMRFHRHFNSPGNPERIEIVIALAKDVVDVEEERLRLPGEMNYANQLQYVIYEFLMNMLRPHFEEDFTAAETKVVITQLVNTIRKSRDEPNVLSKRSKVKTFNDEEIGKLVLDYIQLAGRNIDDEFKLQAWNYKLIKELKKIILEASHSSALTTKRVYGYLADIDIPSEEQVRLFELKLIYDKEVAEWVKNLPLQPMKTRDDQEFRAEKVAELGEKMVETEAKRKATPWDKQCDKELVEYINKWVSEMPMEPLAVVSVPVVVKQLLNRMQKVNKRILEQRRKYFKDEIQSAEPGETQPDDYKSTSTTCAQKPCISPSKIENAAENLVNAIEKWVNKLPIQGASENDVKVIKNDICNDLFLVVGGMNADKSMFNNSIIYEQLLKEEINVQFEKFPENVNLQNNKEILKNELVDQVMETREMIKQKAAGDNYKHRLENTINVSISNAVPNVPAEDPGFELYKQNLAAQFILDNFDHGDEVVKLKYEKKIKEEIDKYFQTIQNANNNQLCSERIHNDLYSALFKVPIPNETVTEGTVEEIKMKCILEEWLLELPLRSGIEDAGIDVLFEIDQVLWALTKKLYPIEKNESRPDEKMVDVIKKFLPKLPLQAGQESNFDYIAKQLINKFKSTAEERKCSLTTSGDKKNKGKGKISKAKESTSKPSTKTPSSPSSKQRPSSPSSRKGPRSPSFRQVPFTPLSRQAPSSPPPEHATANRLNESQLNANEQRSVDQTQQYTCCQETIYFQKPQDLIKETVHTWCHHIPLLPQAPEEELNHIMIKESLATKILLKISELNDNPVIFNNDNVYDHALNEELEKLLTNLPACCELQQSKDMKKMQLTKAIKSIKPLIKKEKKLQAYDKELIECVASILGKPINIPEDQGVAFTEIETNIVDGYINHIYNKDDDELFLKYRAQIDDDIQKFLQLKTQLHPDTLRTDPLIMRNMLISELNKIAPPSSDAIRQHALVSKMKDEVEEFFRALPFPKLNEEQMATRNKVKIILAKKLHDIEKSGHNCVSHDKMKTEISRAFRILNLDKNQIIIDEFVNKLKESENTRKSPQTRRPHNDAVQERASALHLDSLVVEADLNRKLRNELREFLDQSSEKIETIVAEHIIQHLASLLNDLEKSGHDSNIDQQMKQEVMNTLGKLNVSVNAQQVNAFVDNLNRTENSRKSGYFGDIFEEDYNPEEGIYTIPIAANYEGYGIGVGSRSLPLGWRDPMIPPGQSPVASTNVSAGLPSQPSFGQDLTQNSIKSGYNDGIFEEDYNPEKGIWTLPIPANYEGRGVGIGSRSLPLGWKPPMTPPCQSPVASTNVSAGLPSQPSFKQDRTENSRKSDYNDGIFEEDRNPELGIWTLPIPANYEGRGVGAGSRSLPLGWRPPITPACQSPVGSTNVSAGLPSRPSFGQDPAENSKKSEYHDGVFEEGYNPELGIWTLPIPANYEGRGVRAGSRSLPLGWRAPTPPSQSPVACNNASAGLPSQLSFGQDPTDNSRKSVYHDGVFKEDYNPEKGIWTLPIPANYEGRGIGIGSRSLPLGWKAPMTPPGQPPVGSTNASARLTSQLSFGQQPPCRSYPQSPAQDRYVQEWNSFDESPIPAEMRHSLSSSIPPMSQARARLMSSPVENIEKTQGKSLKQSQNKQSTATKPQPEGYFLEEYMENLHLMKRMEYEVRKFLSQLELPEGGDETLYIRYHCMKELVRGLTEVDKIDYNPANEEIVKQEILWYLNAAGVTAENVPMDKIDEFIHRLKITQRIRREPAEPRQTNIDTGHLEQSAGPSNTARGDTVASTAPGIVPGVNYDSFVGSIGAQSSQSRPDASIKGFGADLPYASSMTSERRHNAVRDISGRGAIDPRYTAEAVQKREERQARRNIDGTLSQYHVEDMFDSQGLDSLSQYIPRVEQLLSGESGETYETPRSQEGFRRAFNAFTPGNFGRCSCTKRRKKKNCRGSPYCTANSCDIDDCEDLEEFFCCMGIPYPYPAIYYM